MRTGSRLIILEKKGKKEKSQEVGIFSVKIIKKNKSPCSYERNTNLEQEVGT